VRARFNSSTWNILYDAEIEQSIQLKQANAAAFQKCLELYFEKNFTETQKLFNKICERKPQDKLAAIYSQRSLKNGMSGVPEG
jgi:two-component system, sensor histidine kinase ChiS